MLPTGLPRELLEMAKVGMGDPKANIANTLGDFQFEYNPPAYDFDDDYMGIRDKYNFPTSNFFPGSPFNISGEITNPEQKREIRNTIFDLQSKQRISDLAKSDPSVMQPHDWDYSPEFYDAQRREDLAKLATEFEEGKMDYDTKKRWRPSWQNIRDAGSLLYAGAKKTVPIGWAMSAFDKFKPTNTDNTLSLLSRGDPDIGKGLSGKVSWAGRAYDKKHGAGAYKQKQIDDKWGKIKDIDYKTPEKKAWKTQMEMQTSAYKAKQAAVTAQAAKTAQERVARGEGRDYGHTETRASSGWERSPFYQGGRVGFSKGGIVDLWQELSNL